MDSPGREEDSLYFNEEDWNAIIADSDYEDQKVSGAEVEPDIQGEHDTMGTQATSTPGHSPPMTPRNYGSHYKPISIKVSRMSTKWGHCKCREVWQTWFEDETDDTSTPCLPPIETCKWRQDNFNENEAAVAVAMCQVNNWSEDIDRMVAAYMDEPCFHPVVSIARLTGLKRKRDLTEIDTQSEMLVTTEKKARWRSVHMHYF